MTARDVASRLSDQQVLSELERVKVLFQARAIAAVIGVPAPDTLAVRQILKGQQ